MACIHFHVKRRAKLTHNPKVCRHTSNTLGREIKVMLTFILWPISQCHKVDWCLADYQHQLFAQQNSRTK